jgi:hypothetical protein
MQHWYAFHSDKTMKHTYASVAASQMYVTRPPAFLTLGDFIWVVEGDLSKPMNFQLADCFKVERTRLPPFSAGYERFALKLEGTRSLLARPLALSKSEPWFARLHANYITKRKFFNPLFSEPAVLRGLLKASGVVV